jgi:hypothetical protein
MIHTVWILPITSPVAGHLVSTTGPDPFHCPSKTPGIAESVGNERADKTRDALVERSRRETGDTNRVARRRASVMVGCVVV